MTAEQDWLKDRVAYLKGLKSPNDQQALLIALADKPSLSTQEQKKLSLLIKAEKAAVRAAKARQAAASLIHAERRAL